MRLDEIAWPSVPPRPLVLVPIGSTEQHGPHLPFDTDAAIATAVAQGAADALERAAVGAASVVVTPALNFGASGEHQAFAGTVSIGHEALRFVIVELVRSLSTWAGRIVFVNAHGGNVPTLASAVPQMLGEGHDVGWLPCAAPGADAHAGRTETSLMLWLRPSAVASPLPEAGATAPMAELLPKLTSGGVTAVSPTGVLGDPTGATAEEGAALLATMVADATSRVLAHAPDSRGQLAVPRP
ncbi:MAG: mycofactocin biosynthesis peptidyl-dipeptidase MftE [Herbiconiux sp.]|nr:MAG: mycofactocin biosynthesis peptidyl-dipeptidase MftE [Herbiconiux sp.]